MCAEKQNSMHKRKEKGRERRENDTLDRKMLRSERRVRERVEELPPDVFTNERESRWRVFDY